MFDVMVDGQFVGIINTTRLNTSYPIASNLDDDVHSVLITKRTEAVYGPTVFLGFEVDEDRWLVPSTPSDRRLEFIGDSITCGFGADGHAPCPYTKDTENAYDAYGAVTARILNAQFQQESWSGIGLVRNSGDPNPVSQYPLPTRYPYIIPSQFAFPWDFSRFVPHAVIINLGTNADSFIQDFSGSVHPPQELFQNTYIQFIANITKLYNPAPKFFLVCGPMESSTYCPYTQYVATHTNSTYVSLENLLVNGDWGCDSHPGVTGHQKMAKATAAAIQQVLGWN